MRYSQKPGLVLAIHPTSRGFGWVLFEGPVAPAVWGIATAKINRSAWSMVRFEKLLDQYQPRAVLLEKEDPNGSPASDRVRLLSRDMRGFAANRDIEVHVYSRAEVAVTLVLDENATRSAVVEATADILPILRDRLPSPRKPWQSEDGRRCLFDAAALGIAHYRITHRDP
jgi:hypothetical protein